MPVRPCPPDRGHSSVAVSDPNGTGDDGDRAGQGAGSGAGGTPARPDDQRAWQALGSLWDEAFDGGRLAALDELQDRFCVCMK